MSKSSQSYDPQSVAPLCLKGVSVGGQEETAVRLAPTDFMLHAGEWLYLVGTNGSGKSSLLRLLSGIHEPDCEGEMIRGFAQDHVAPIVLQQPKLQLFGETPREEVGFAMEWRQVPPQHRKEQGERILERFDLLELADEPWANLSGGEQQLAAIAAALVEQTELLIFDEATSMLDANNQKKVLEIVRERHAQGAAVVWCTQRLDELRSGTRLVAMQEGRIVYDGQSEDFFYPPASDNLSVCEHIGLPVPYMVQLARALQATGQLHTPLPLEAEQWEQLWQTQHVVRKGSLDEAGIK